MSGSTENKFDKEYIDSLKNEGPSEITIPAVTYNSCQGCKFYEYKMMKSGWNPIYSHNCEHPDIRMVRLPSSIFGHGNLADDKTPDWCPYLKKKEK